MANEDLVSVRQRLENLKKNPIYVPIPLDNTVPDKEAKPIGGGGIDLWEAVTAKDRQGDKKDRAHQGKDENFGYVHEPFL